MRVVSYTRTTSCFPGETGQPSDIIAVQNRHIADYAGEHGWKVDEKYSDRKHDNEEDSAFRRLLEDGMRRKFDMVIVDSVFRAGKDLWDAREVLLQTFYYADISFAVVEDDFIASGRKREDVDNYFAEKYSLYRKAHIVHQVRERNKNGILCWNDEKYGYRLSEDNRELIINPETAPVVNRIFRMYAERKTPLEIADILTEEKILKPKAAKGTRAKVKEPYRWSALTISRLIKNTAYAGFWEKTIYGVRHAFTNEPIVSRELFDTVQRIRRENESTAVKRNPVCRNRYAGLVCDSREGFCLHLRTVKSGEQYFVYDRNQRERGGDRHVLVADVDVAVTRALREEKERAARIAALIRSEGKERCTLAKEKLKQAYRNRAMVISDAEKERMDLAARVQTGEAAGEELADLTRKNDALIHGLEEEFKKYPGKLLRLETAYSTQNPWLTLMLSWEVDMPLSRETLCRFVSKIMLDRLTTIQVELKEREWFHELPKDWRE